MKTNKLELVVSTNIHFETDNVLILGYRSQQEAFEAGWKPSANEWYFDGEIVTHNNECWLYYQRIPK